MAIAVTFAMNFRVFLYGNRNRVGAIVLKYPVVNLPQPLRRPGVHADQPAPNPIPYGK